MEDLKGSLFKRDIEDYKTNINPIAGYINQATKFVEVMFNQTPEEARKTVLTKIKEYGINNCLIEMNLVIEIKQQIMLPLISKKIKIINDIPISYKVINGKIPEYYSGSLSKGSNIYSIPIE